MQRRALLGGALALVCAPGSAIAQSKTTQRIGVLSFGSPDPFRERFRQALRGLGFVDGTNITIEHRWASGQIERLGDLAADLVRQDVDVIVANATPSIEAALAATRTIPIVMASAGDALRTGLVDSLARPRGNVTGLSLALIELAGKTVEIFRETLPGLRRVACIVHRDDPLHRGFIEGVESSTQRSGIGFQPFVLAHHQETQEALASLARGGATGVILQPIFSVDPQARHAIVRQTIELRLPSISGLGSYAQAGGLAAYAAEFKDLPERAAAYVAKILKGARPAELPVEQPTRFELWFNLRTAKAIGVTIPASMLARADHLVE